jgi:hypothetical protein
MNNDLLQLKIKQRLNKLASFDYDNIECWQIVEAFNKIQLEWVSREIDRAEQSKKSLERMQILLKQASLAGTNQRRLYESISLPPDYLSFKRVSFDGIKEGCKESRTFRTYLAEEANLDDLLDDPVRRPSFEWGETFMTMIGNRIHIHTNGDFLVKDPVLVYYRKPALVSIVGCVDPGTGEVSFNDQPCEFGDEIAEMLVSDTAAQLAADIESVNQVQINAASVQRNTQ